jgi:hypothetical protein
MKDLIKKWWNRTWSNWEYDGKNEIYEYSTDKYPHTVYEIYKIVSSDGIVQIKRVKR